MALIKIGKPSRESLRPFCFPPTLNGWQGGPPMMTDAPENLLLTVNAICSHLPRKFFS